MRLLQVTLGSGATQVIANQDTVTGGYNTYCSLLIIQNNATHNVRAGDNTVSSTKGILITPSGSLTANLFIVRGTLLSQWYLYGTQGDVIDILYETSN
jgi:hypothetical protein